MKILFKLLFTLAISITYFHLMLMVVVAYDIQPLVGIFLLSCTAIVFVSCYIGLTNIFCYLGILKRRFQLCIEYRVSNGSEIVYFINGYSKNPVPKIKTVSKEVYKYSCRGLCINLNKEKAERFFLDPMNPTINELTMFELCGYHDYIQTFGELYDYSKSFDELFGYYMQQGFVNKVKYVIKNRDRF